MADSTCLACCLKTTKGSRRILARSPDIFKMWKMILKSEFNIEDEITLTTVVEQFQFMCIRCFNSYSKFLGLYENIKCSLNRVVNSDMILHSSSQETSCANLVCDWLHYDADECTSGTPTRHNPAVGRKRRITSTDNSPMYRKRVPIMLSCPITPTTTSGAVTQTEQRTSTIVSYYLGLALSTVHLSPGPIILHNALFKNFPLGINNIS